MVDGIRAARGEGAGRRQIPAGADAVPRRLADGVRAVAREGVTTLVAVDGAGGSGKSTLAAAASELLDGATVVHGDDFYRVMPAAEREQLGAEEGYRRYF